MQYKVNYHANDDDGDGDGQVVPLKAFFNYIADRGMDFASVVQYDNHWKPMELFCYPCAVKYDYFVNIDHLGEEINFIMDKITNGRFHLNIRNENATAKQQQKVELMRTSGISEEFFRQISSIYQRDYEMFGFQYPDNIYF